MADKKYLDQAGLQTLLASLNTKVGDKIKTYVSDNSVVLGTDGKIPASYLPSYIDDILEFAGTTSNSGTNTSTSSFTSDMKVVYNGAVKVFLLNPISERTDYFFPKWTAGDGGAASSSYGTETDAGVTPSTGKLYFDTVNNKLYRWSGSAMVDISAKDVGTTGLAFTSPATLKWSENGTAKTATIPDATTSANGLMTTAMVTKLNGIAAGANAYTLPTASSTVLGGIKVGSNLAIASGVLSAKTMTAATASAAGAEGYVPAPAAGAQAKFLRGDGTWQTPTNTTYALATASANGLMSAADFKKLQSVTFSSPTWRFGVSGAIVTIGASPAAGIINTSLPTTTVSTSTISSNVVLSSALYSSASAETASVKLRLDGSILYSKGTGQLIADDGTKATALTTAEINTAVTSAFA